MISDAQFADWLKDQSAIRCVLVEVPVKLAGGGTTTRYLSNRAYVTSGSDTPANTAYSARIVGGIKYTRSLSLDGQASLSYGDIELSNIDGDIDSWVDDYWENRSISIFVGDVSWARRDFRQVFAGTTTGIDMRKRDRLNIKISDVLQRLNTPISDVKLGGAGETADSLLPLCFGECHNVTPLLFDSNVNEYMVHNGPIEGIIEVRDNGVPVAFTPYLSTGKFRLTASPTGTVTASVQGAKIPSTMAYTTGDFAGWTPIETAIAMSTTESPTSGHFSRALSASTEVNANIRTIRVAGSGAPFTFVTASAVFQPGDYATISVFVKKAYTKNVGLIFDYKPAENTIAAAYNVIVDAESGTVATPATIPAAYSTGGGDVKPLKIELLENGWVKVTLTLKSIVASPFGVRISARSPTDPNAWQYTVPVGTELIYIGGFQIDRGMYASQFLPTGNGDAPTYKNSVVEIVKHVVKTYGNTATKFTDSDLDLAALAAFDSAHRQQIGVYIPDRQNVLDLVTKLTSSIGARLIPNGTGKCSLIKLTLPQPTPGTQVGSPDFVSRSIDVKQLTNVVAAVKIGYAKNWTIQDALTTGIPAEHADLYAKAWLTTTQVDATAATNYNLFTDPVLAETFLLTEADASAEASRRLNIFNVRRKIIKYVGFYHLLQEPLGGSQTITHPRFGLSSGKTGQIISISVDFMSPHIDFEVLI